MYLFFFKPHWPGDQLYAKETEPQMLGTYLLCQIGGDITAMNVTNSQYYSTHHYNITGNMCKKKNELKTRFLKVVCLGVCI